MIVTDTVAVPPDRYAGSDPVRRRAAWEYNQLARRVEMQLQRMLDGLPPGGAPMAVTTAMLARSLGVAAEPVGRMLAALGGDPDQLYFARPPAPDAAP